MPYRIAFLVTRGNAHVITVGLDREDAKRTAHRWLDGNPDEYIVTPLTREGDRIKIDLTVQV